MQTYKAPLRDMRFVLQELHADFDTKGLPGLEDFTPDVADAILEEAASSAPSGCCR